MKDLVRKLFGVIAIGLLGFVLGRCHREDRQPGKTETITEVVTIRDTITIVKPISKVERVTDTIRIVLPPVTDTLTIRDTLYLPITQKYYHSSDFEAWISGYKPHLDSIKVYPLTKIVNKEVVVKERPKRWGLGIQAGVGIGLANNKVVGVPYVGVGISYNLVRW